MWNMFKFYWLASRGYRLQPWNSPYIQWRLETFLGKEAANLDAQEILSPLLEISPEYEFFCRLGREAPPLPALLTSDFRLPTSDFRLLSLPGV